MRCSRGFVTVCSVFPVASIHVNCEVLLPEPVWQASIPLFETANVDSPLKFVGTATFSAIGVRLRPTVNDFGSNF